MLLRGRVGSGYWDSKDESHTEQAGVRKPWTLAEDEPARGDYLRKELGDKYPDLIIFPSSVSCLGSTLTVVKAMLEGQGALTDAQKAG